jgi:hypothetical protein
VGSTWGLLDLSVGPDIFSNLVCFKHDIMDLYPYNVSGCDALTQINSFETQPSFSISPNPFHDHAIIHSGSEFSNTELIIYNLYGQQVKRQIIRDNDALIESAGLCAGIYFYQATDTKGKTTTGKLVIE